MVLGLGRFTPKRFFWRRRLGWAGAAALAALALAGVAVRAAYPGLTSGLLNQARHGTWEEDRNTWAYVSYLLPFLEKLTWDPQAGLYNFRLTPEAGLGDFERGRLAFHRGDFGPAIALLERHIAVHGETEEALFWLAMSYLRRAERENCLAAMQAEPAGAAHDPSHEAAQYCTLPIVRLHQRQELSRHAAALFTQLLDRHHPGEDDARLYRWLLNLSWMTVGGFPREVPPRYLLHTGFIDAFYGAGAEQVRRENADLRFVDRARELGIASFGAGRGVAVEDFDRDGDLDVVAAGLFDGLRYYRNEGGRFVDATAGSGLDAIRQPLTVSAADFDGDGWIDLFVVCPFDRFHLFRNRGDGTFVDVTRESGLLDAISEGTVATSWISTWGDVDNDGDLDLFVSSWAFRVPFVSGLPAKPRLDSKLFVNEGGHFRDATAEYGLADLVKDQHFIGAAFGDYDGDGRLDLFLSSPLFGASVLLHNEGGRFAPDGRFTRRAPGFTAAFVDVDHDGRLDIFQAGFGDARTAVGQSVFGDDAGNRSGHSTILLQTADGRFEAHDEFFGGAMPMGTMGASYGDLDNDGCLDFYLGTGNPEPWFILPNLLYRGEERDGHCTGRMRNISALDGFGNLQKGHGIVFFDFDGDGHQDIYSSLGGMWPGDRWPSQLFVNESKGSNSWIKIRLRGRRSNFYGLGSQIEVRGVTAAGRPVVRTYNMDSKTGFGSAPYLAHIGMGSAVRVEAVRVRWLGSGCVGSYPARLRELNLLDEADCLQGAADSRAAPSPR